MTHALVTRIVITAGTARGVELTRRGQSLTIDAHREVIVSAGAMNSPKLLMLSGVGPADELARHGIALVAESPRVGLNAQNHPGVDVQFGTAPRLSLTREIGLLRRPLFGAQWLLTRRGIAGSNLFEGGAFLRTREDVDFPNMQYEFLPLTRKLVNGRLLAIPGFQVWMDLSRPYSRGRVTLTSADPSAPVSTVFNTYSDPRDLRDVVDGVRLLREHVVRQPALRHLDPVELEPGPDTRDAEAMAAWVRHATGTSYHASSTCSMGTGNDDSVVDGQGRVHAVAALRVVDGSIIPNSITGNLHAGIMMIAEKITDAICGRALPPSDAGFYFEKGT